MRVLVIGILALLALFLVGGLFLPGEVTVTRSVVIERSPQQVFDVLNSYRHFTRWSPWADKDPDAQYTYEGPDSGVGARMSWSGDPRLLPAGSQEITVSEPHRRIETSLDFAEQGMADSYFVLEPRAGGTELTWGFHTELDDSTGWLDGIIWRWMGLFFDRWVGTDYERGLASLKAFVESMPDADYGGLQVERVNAEAVPILYVAGQTTQDPADISAALAEAYGEISAFMAGHGIAFDGQPMAITRGWDENGYRFEAAIPARLADQQPSGNIRQGLSPSGSAVRAVHKGPYAQLMSTYEQLAAWMAAHGLEEGAVSWEHYISDPGNTDETELITHIYFLIDEPTS